MHGIEGKHAQGCIANNTNTPSQKNKRTAPASMEEG